MSDIQLACRTDPWGDDGFIAALTDLAEMGFQGVVAGPELVERYEDRISVIEEIFQEARIRLAAIAATAVRLSAEHLEEEIERALHTARFLHAAGSDLLLASLPDWQEGPTPEEAKLAAEWLNQVGKATLELDVDTCFLPRLARWPRTSTEINRFIGTTTAKYVRLAYDSWMMYAGVAVSTFFQKHGGRVRFAVVEDLKMPPKRRRKADAAGPPPEPLALGAGNLPLSRLARALFSKGFEGWVALSLPADSVDPRSDARTALTYAEDKLDLLF